MNRTLVLVAAAALVPAAAVSQARQEAPPSALAPPPATTTTTTTTAPAPAFEAGMQVRDRTGAVLGEIASVAPGANGELQVVVSIDGKLVGVSERSLRLTDGGAVSSQTKAQILAAAGAPR